MLFKGLVSPLNISKKKSKKNIKAKTKSKTKLNSKKKLLMSTSDVISYRRDISTGKYNQKSFKNHDIFCKF